MLQLASVGTVPSGVCMCTLESKCDSWLALLLYRLVCVCVCERVNVTVG